MASFHAPVMKIVPGFMALGVLGESVKTLPQKWGSKQSMKPGKLIRGFTNIMIGTPMISPVATMAGAL